jgi:hypothetical protein
MHKIIIGIHGLGNKPPDETLTCWWRQSIADGFKEINKPFSHKIFELVYWADVLHRTPLITDEIDEKHPLYLDEPYSKAGKIIRGFREPLQQKISDYIQKQIDKLILNDDLSVNFSSISDYIIHRFFHDLEVYYMSEEPVSENSNLLPREAIRQRLISTLMYHRKKKILLIAHSMGSIIAYDVLNAGIKDVQIDTLVTCGSPLGIPVIKNKIRAERKLTSNPRPLAVPDTISRHWYNLSDLHDRVAIDYKLADDYLPNHAGVAIRDLQVTNSYEYKGEKNPHKAYGYLRTPEMAEIISAFLCENDGRFKIWLMEKINQVTDRRKGNRKGR